MNPLILLAVLAATDPTPSSPNSEPAKPPEQGAQPSGGDDLARELEQVLANPSPPSATKSASGPAGSGLLNPDISVISDGVIGGWNQRPIFLSGDDPDLAAGAAGRALGLTLQELEIGFQSTVDPYFIANAFLTIPNLQGLEVEEAYAATTSLPWGFQLKAGVFRSSAGRQNEQHLHTQSFSLRPLINAAYLGPDGLRGPGAQLSWLAPTPFFLRLAAEVFSLPHDAELLTFGGASRYNPSAVATAKTFFDLGSSLSLMLGGTFAFGHAPVPDSTGIAPPELQGPRSWMAGGDLYLKWKRPNDVEGYFWLALQAEYFYRHIAPSADAASLEPVPAQLDGGAYAQLVAQIARRWQAGVRFDLLGLPESELIHRAARLSGMFQIAPSEFSRVRLQYFRGLAAAAPEQGLMLLLEYSIGAHGAHPY